MYCKRLVCAAYTQMNITADQTRRLMYIGDNGMLKELIRQKFEFEVVTVNNQGKIIERKTSRTQQFTEDLEVEPFDRPRANGVKTEDLEVEPFDRLRANGVKKVEPCT